MFESGSEECSGSEEVFFLGNLAPPKPHKQATKTFKPINTVLKRGMDREINARVRKQRKQRKELADFERQRSRSRDKYRQGGRRGQGGKQNITEGATFASLNGGSSKSNKLGDKDVIEILSSDQESKGYNQFQALERSIYEPVKLQAIDYLNWRQRRRLDRMFQRKRRHHINGKQRDQLSFEVFNTIEDYFR